VPSRAIGFVEQGSKVVLRYQAFPYQKFGQQYGRVTEISLSALTPSEVGTLGGRQVSEPMYRVKVELEKQYVMAYGKAQPIKPGMALDADIMLDRRRLIEWVLGPVYGVTHDIAGAAAHG
jgi:membrane fusion protein